ncbi:hypothetical protein RirG_249070 [Rhizophagus irregularis DAOM 197198w]|nr:hypothetical protein RirG_249070 [Rhizophagus irregularis DAOM 197198w]
MDGIAVTLNMVKFHMKEILIKQFAHIQMVKIKHWFYGFLKGVGYLCDVKQKLAKTSCSS